MLSPAPAKARTRLTGLLALTALTALAAALAAGPARADSVRDAQQWVLQAINATPAWSVSEGQGVTVAVIDSGVNPEVSDLAGSVITGPDLTGVGTPPSNANWGMHGTWMASLIAGHGHGGGDGILGVAPHARVLSIRVITDRLDPGYARYQHEPSSRVQRELAAAITDAVTHGAGVISMSLGYGRPSRLVRLALQDAFDRGVVVIASSGNSGGPVTSRSRHAPYSFPADYPGVLGVAAIGQSGGPASFSSDNLSVQVAAPGVRVPAQGKDGNYWLVSGTSPACALTAGVAALIRSAYPALSAALVRHAITTTTRSRPAGGYNDQVGFGTVDAAAAVTAAGRLAAAARLTAKSPDKRSIAAQSHFGGGPEAIPAAPVGPRGLRPLVLFFILGLGCLAMIVTATSRLVLMRRPPPAGGQRPDTAQSDGQPGGDPSGRHAAPPGGKVSAGRADEPGS